MKRLILISVFCLIFLSGCGAAGLAPSAASTNSNPPANQYGFAAANINEQKDEISAIMPIEATGDASVPMEDGKELSIPLTLMGTGSVRRISVSYSTEPIDICAEDGTQLMTGQNTDAIIETDSDEINIWLDSLRKATREDAQHTVDDLLDTAKMAYEYEDTPFYTYSYYDSMDVARIDSKIVSLITHHSIFSGGAHPYGYWETANLDLDQMQELTLDDIIEPEKMQQLYDMILLKVDAEYESMGEGSLYPDYREQTMSHMEYAPQCWYFSEKGLCFYFNPYEIAPYAAGIIQIMIPYCELDGVLQEDFFPLQQRGETALVIVSEDRGSTIQVNPGESGKAMHIGAEKAVGTLRINRLIWIADMAIDSENIFTISNLFPDEVLNVIVTEDTDQPQYQITVSDGAGGETNYYLSEYGLQQQK